MNDIALWSFSNNELEGIDVPRSVCHGKHAVIQEMLINLLTVPGSCFANPTIGCGFIQDWQEGVVDTWLPHSLQIYLTILKMLVNSRFAEEQIENIDVNRITEEDSNLFLSIEISFKDGSQISLNLKLF